MDIAKKGKAVFFPKKRQRSLRLLSSKRGVRRTLWLQKEFIVFTSYIYSLWNQVCLLGHQAMRERQLKKLGYKVMHVNYSEVNKLLVVPSRLNNYLKSKYDEALKS